MIALADHAVVVAGLDEQRRYLLRYSFGYQVHDGWRTAIGRSRADGPSPARSDLRVRRTSSSDVDALSRLLVQLYAFELPGMLHGDAAAQTDAAACTPWPRRPLGSPGHSPGESGRRAYTCSRPSRLPRAYPRL